MQFLHPQLPLVQEPINSRRDCQRPADNGTDARQKPRETFWSRLAIDNLHRGDVVVEEDTRDATLGVDAPIARGVRRTADGSLVRGDGVLVRFDAGASGTVLAQGNLIQLLRAGEGGNIGEWEVRRRHDLDEVDVVVRRLVGELLRAVQRVGMVVVRPVPSAGDLVRQRRAKAQLVDDVRHRVLVGFLQVIGQVCFEIVHVHVTRAVAAAGSDVEVAHNFVHPDHALEAAAFPSLCV